ncbi:MAG: hypothetical protein Q9226_002269 [Calogaya cf. arnoldii]
MVKHTIFGHHSSTLHQPIIIDEARELRLEQYPPPVKYILGFALDDEVGKFLSLSEFPFSSWGSADKGEKAAIARKSGWEEYRRHRKKASESFSED